MAARRADAVAPVLLSLFFLLCACAGDGGDAYLVTRVVDGDTIIIDMNGTEERVRLIGIDTPESVHPDGEQNVPYGEIAASFTKNALEGKRVRIELDAQTRDKYGRLLAYVYTDDAMFNETLLSEGHAQLATYPPNVRHVEAFAALQKDARERGAGLWAYLAEEAAEDGDAAASPQNGESGKDGAVRYAGGFIGNAGTKKFHLPACRYVPSIKEAHIVRFGTCEEARAAGFVPCKVCNPQ
ncbi:MAG: thermonuclease family protein [Clostridiales Family XIII bacterium]|jgi:micrococcal nuclease|nr:thermonuclease family protein [Clostridiales Family XIII bacterium]